MAIKKRLTKAQWVKCTDSQRMLAFLRRKASGRKLTFFAAACCRRSSHFGVDELSKQGVEWAERWVDGVATPDDPDAPPEEDWFRMAEGENRCIAAAYSTLVGNIKRAFECAQEAAKYMVSPASGRPPNEAVGQAVLIRDIFGNPFRPMTVDPNGITTNVIGIAQAIYTDRAFDRLPILADALEDAGCTNADILNHCRQPGEHVRGCWVVDLVLGKS